MAQPPTSPHPPPVPRQPGLSILGPMLDSQPMGSLLTAASGGQARVAILFTLRDPRRGSVEAWGTGERATTTLQNLSGRTQCAAWRNHERGKEKWLCVNKALSNNTPEWVARKLANLLDASQALQAKSSSGFSTIFCMRPRSEFYDDITKQFLTRYGYDLGFEENVPGDIDAWVPVDRKLGLTGEELKKENDFQESRKKESRDQKLGNWFRHRFTGKRLHSGALNTILKWMQAMTGNGACPRRKPNVTVYSGKHYATKLKGTSTRFGRTGETMPPGTHISMCQDYVKMEIAAEADALHVEALKEYNDRSIIPEQSAEDYHHGLPLADALSEWLGMHTVIMAVGPVGEQKGEVQLQTYLWWETKKSGASLIVQASRRPRHR
ncbi:hypothetical protein B0H13DRAFT_1897609 [Mycena leptocephala]|nr:hypothetical protein B0H13DRAFT_1897609 [Mycena leptocephala]